MSEYSVFSLTSYTRMNHMKAYNRFTRSLALFIPLVVLGACSSDSVNTPEIDAELSLQEQLKVVVDDAVESGLPGVSLHVQSGRENIDIVAGVANRDTAEPVTPSSLFHAASIGKTFTATMILRLIDVGFLQLEDPIGSLLDPSMSSMIHDSDRITVEMLLGHTSGLHDYFGNPEFAINFLESPGRIWSPLEILGFIDNTQNNFEPGTEFSYSNTNTVLLGVIAERVTGLPIGMALREWVFQPAGLENTFGVFENLGQPEAVRGYIPVDFVEDIVAEFDLTNIDVPLDGSDLDSSVWLHSEGHGDASVHSTSSDLNSFIRTLIDTEALVSGDLKTRMLTEIIPGAGHGLGLFISDNGLMFEHAGDGLGVSSWMSFSPSADLSFATVVNGSFGTYGDIYSDYLNQLISVLERHE